MPNVPADKRYSVGATGTYHALASTIADAKAKGKLLANKAAWRGKWNLMYLTFGINKYDSMWSSKATGWFMYVPVRGSGASADKIIAEIKRRHGVKPFVWTRRK